MSYQLSQYRPPKLTKNFRNAVQWLYRRFFSVHRDRQISRFRFPKKLLVAEEEFSEKWTEFFDAFGTHYVTEMTTGSRFKALTILKKSTTKRVEESKQSVTQEMSYSVNFKNIAMAVVGGGAIDAAMSAAKEVMKKAKGGAGKLVQSLGDKSGNMFPFSYFHQVTCFVFN